MARIAEDNDFDQLKKLVDESEGWILELDKSDTKVWTRPVEGCSFQMVKIQTTFPDITSEVLYDVLHDPDYRRVWDSNMIESLEIGLLNVNNDVGYYASKFILPEIFLLNYCLGNNSGVTWQSSRTTHEKEKMAIKFTLVLVQCPPPLKPRDFVLQRSWLDTGPNGEQMLISRSVPHKDYPPKKGYVRAFTHITGFLLRSRTPESGCVLNYVAQCDPCGKLPPWLVNKVTHTLGPRMIKDLRKAALGYVQWKQNQSHFRKPWRYPEDITVPRILIEDCWESLNGEDTNDSRPQTPVKCKAITKASSPNGDTNNIVDSNSATSSPVTAKKPSKLKKFKFKFEK